MENKYTKKVDLTSLRRAYLKINMEINWDNWRKETPDDNGNVFWNTIDVLWARIQWALEDDGISDETRDTLKMLERLVEGMQATEQLADASYIED